MEFAPQIVLLARSGPSNATVAFEVPQTGQNPEFFEVSYFCADTTAQLDQVCFVHFS